MKIESALLFRAAISGRDDTGDAMLVRRIIAGDADAWSTFFDRYSPWCYRFAYWHLNSNHADAEDLCSEIMLNAAKSIARFNTRRGDLNAWMHGLARNCLAHYCRSRKREAPLPDDIEIHTSEPGVSNPELRDVINQTLAALSERQASALIAKYVEGRTTEEVARSLGSSLKAAESLLVRSRAAFRSTFNILRAENENGGGRDE